MEDLDDHGRPEVRNFVDPETDKEIWICLSSLLGHKTTLHFAERKAKLLVNWAKPHLEL